MSVTYTPEQRSGAIEILNRMQTIVDNEMVAHHGYVTEVQRPDLAEAGAICGGHKACAVGSLWLAAGIRPMYNDDLGWYLTGVTVEGEGGVTRTEFLRRYARRKLRLAYEELCEVSADHMNREGLNPRKIWAENGALEQLFEGIGGDNRIMDGVELTPIISEAKARIEAMS